MVNKRYVVELTQEERDELKANLKEKGVSAKKRMRSQILLKVDEGEDGPAWSHAKAANAFDVHMNTVTAVVKKLILEGFEAAINRKKHRRNGRNLVITGDVEKTLIAFATGKPPEGYAHWTLRLLADRLIELQVMKSVSHETVRKVLKKKKSPCIRWRNG